MAARPQGPRGASDGRGKSDTAWESQFAFDLSQVAPSDMATGCHWAATHPSSRFTQATVVNRCLVDGFASLVDRRFAHWRAGGPAETATIANPADYSRLLSDRFGLVLEESDAARLPLWD